MSDAVDVLVVEKADEGRAFVRANPKFADWLVVSTASGEAGVQRLTDVKSIRSVIFVTGSRFGRRSTEVRERVAALLASNGVDVADLFMRFLENLPAVPRTGTGAE